MNNYDSNGFSTGLSVAELFGELELTFLANRKRLFVDALKTDDFKTACFARFSEYNKANAKAIQNINKELTALTVKELTNSFNVGERSVINQVAAYKKQGYKNDKAINKERLNATKLMTIASTLQAFLSVAEYGRQAADNQVKYIVTQASRQPTTQDIDSIQGALLKKGISGRSLANGAEKAMTAESEFIMRNHSAEALRTAQGTTRAEYGINLVRVSAHPSSCDKCIPWQDKVLIDDRFGGVADGVHALISTAIDSGLFHFNCRHEVTEEIPGLTNPKRNEYRKLSNKETAKTYAVEREQRHNERMIRQYKLRAEGSLTQEQTISAQHKVAEWQARQRELMKLAERENVRVFRQYSREQIGGKTQPTLPRALFGY